MIKTWQATLLASCLTCSLVVSSVPAEEGCAGPASESLTAKPQDLQWWREARFGLFIHWGPVSLKGTEIGWSRGGERRGTGGKGEIPLEVYDNLYKEFNPVKFNADEWVAIAKAAGMKYLVFTSKHHDGFCEFDSKLTDYKVTNSPFKRDIVKELADACHKAELPVGWYYSPPDWHHPDYRTDRHAKYIEYLHGQLRELCTNYGKINIIWFDGLGGTAKDWDAPTLLRMIRKLQPGVIINNRAGLPADHDTPEQTVGGFNIQRPWESCITICRQWAWKPNDHMKSLKECLRTLINCAGGDGNLLFNVGPMPTGEIEPRQVERLKEMGAWLGKYGQTIYGTRGGPFKPGPWGACTRSGNTLYVHFYPRDNRDQDFKLPPIPRKIVGHEVLTGGSCEVRQSDTGIEISVPAAHVRDIDTLVALKLDGPAEDLAPIRVPSQSDAVSLDKPAKASNVHQKQSEYSADKAFDDDPGTRWATDGGTHSAWIEVDLGRETTINRATISEACGERIRKFELLSRDGDSWKTFYKGTTVGEKGQFTFDPVRVRVVRLNILEATEGPTIWEFQLYSAKK